MSGSAGLSSVASCHKVIAKDEMRRFMVHCMTAVGTSTSHAKQLADVLVEGDYRGHYSHGLNRLKMYVGDVKGGSCRGQGDPEIVKETSAIACVDGGNLLGPVVGNFCMDLAIDKAKQVGIGWVVARGSNHYGIAGWYSLRACQQGFLGMSFTNTSPCVAVARGKKSTIGTNPISVAAPARNGDSFVLDMATSSVAVGKIEMQDRKGEKIPRGWGIDKTGKVTTSAKEVLDEGALLPLGGEEETSGYKGTGLSMMVEVFCGILSGATYGANIRRWLSDNKPADLGQCFVAIDPNAFCAGFEDRMSDLLNMYRQEEPVNPALPIMVPGDPERNRNAENDAQNGIAYHQNQIEYARELAKELNVEPPHINE